MTESDKIVIVMDIVSTKKKNTIAKNVKCSASINCYGKKVRDCSIFCIQFY